MKKQLKLSFILLVVVALASTIFVTAYLYQILVINKEREVGQVDVDPNIYFVNELENEPGKYVEMINETVKEKVYHVNIANYSDTYHINKLRIDFSINSNVETYFRVKIIDTLTLIYTNSRGQTVELSVPNEGIEYTINSDLWYLDQNSGWYYFREKVTKDTNPKISFIEQGLNYPLKSPQYKIQLGIKVESVQAHLGPDKNWGFEIKPGEKYPWEVEEN